MLTAQPKEILKEMVETFKFVLDLVAKSKLVLDPQYKKINETYYRIFSSHYESFLMLVEKNHFNSAILIARTLLELYVKSFYLEFIEKEKGSEVIDFLNENKDFPNFFLMTQSLEKYNHPVHGGFDNVFQQFTKKHLATYEKFSLFSHGRGKLLEAFYNNPRLSYSTQDISELLMTVKGLFETLNFLLFYVQDNKPAIGILLENYSKHKFSTMF